MRTLGGREVIQTQVVLDRVVFRIATEQRGGVYRPQGEEFK